MLNVNESIYTKTNIQFSDYIDLKLSSKSVNSTDFDDNKLLVMLLDKSQLDFSTVDDLDCIRAFRHTLLITNSIKGNIKYFVDSKSRYDFINKLIVEDIFKQPELEDFYLNTFKPFLTDFINTGELILR